MMEYWVITLRYPADYDVWTSDLNVLAKDGWRVVTMIDAVLGPRVIMGRELDGKAVAIYAATKAADEMSAAVLASENQGAPEHPLPLCPLSPWIPPP